MSTSLPKYSLNGRLSEKNLVCSKEDMLNSLFTGLTLTIFRGPTQADYSLKNFKSVTSFLHFSPIRVRDGSVSSDLSIINSQLYSSEVSYNTTKCKAFLQNVQLPGSLFKPHCYGPYEQNLLLTI